jgi:SAM-dependent methyltransferase
LVELRIGTSEQFAALRAVLAETGYTAEGVRACLGIENLSEASRIHSRGLPADSREALIRLFLLEEAVPAGSIPGNIAALLESLGLASAADGELTAAVKLYPMQSLYVVSDRDCGRKAQGDHVFSAISPQTEDFLRMLPEGPCPAFLELCAGAGAAALLAASRYAAQAFAFDISERCRAFAEFSRRLNGLTNLTVKRGDLYGPAGRRTFDGIVAHPPYVPSLGAAQVFRDGGEDGERLTRRIVEGLPNYLHPGGRLYLTAMLAELPGETIARRLRRWLRECEPQFDLIVVGRKRLDAGNFLFDNAEPGEIAAWRLVLEQRGIEWFRYVTVILARHAEAEAAVSVSREAGEGFGIRDAERALETARRLRDPQWIADARPRAAGGLEVLTQAALQEGAWRESRRTFRASRPFRVEAEGPVWAEEFFARCDGRRTVAEIGRDMRRDHLAGFVREWIATGLLEAE